MSKVLLGFLAMAVSFSAQASSYHCTGNHESSAGLTLSVLSLAGDDVREGQRFPVALRIDEALRPYGSKTVFAAIVDGESEDVLFALRSRRSSKLKLSGTIYLDELDQTWINLDGRELSFDCKVSGD